MLNVAYKPSWREKVRARPYRFLKPFTPRSGKPSLRKMSMIFDRFAARYRGVIDIFLASAPSQLWGAGAPLFLKKGESQNDSTRD
jgi:hypothetical protein